MHKKFEKILHQFKVDVFHAEHDKESIEKIRDECLHITEDVLEQNYSYHYTKEAILPPVVEKLVQRQIRLEHRFEALLGLTQQILETLSEPQSDTVST